MSVVVYGASGHGKVVADILLSRGESIVGFLDDSRAVGTGVLGHAVLGGFDWLAANPGVEVVLGIGNNAQRAALARRCLDHGAVLRTAIHPSAVIARSARVEAGAVVMALAVVNPDAVIGQGAIINTAAVVEHDCTVGDFAHVSPNATLAGNCHVEALAHLGAGASMLPGTRVGQRSIVGGGALVSRDIPADVVARGVPARVMRPQ